MKQNNTTRIFYTILVPVILLVALMNSGFLQARFPAVSIDGTSYNVAQFNFYYFTIYQEYLSENFDDNGENGPFDTSVSLKTQYCEDGTTWRDYFIQQALDWMAEVAYYTTLAEQDGYTFSDEELAPVQEQMDAIEVARTANSISLKNYLVAYWGVGMTEATYTKELTRATKAAVYQTVLAEEYTPAEEEISTWLEENPQTDYQIAYLQIITLDAVADRETGEIGSDQLEALRQRLDQLVERYQSGTDFATLQADYSTCQLGDEAGNLTVLDEEGLPDALAAWCLSGEALEEGDLCTEVEESNGIGWCALFVGYGGSAAEQKAVEALSLLAIEAQAEQAVAEMTVTQSSLFMRLAGA